MPSRLWAWDAITGGVQSGRRSPISSIDLSVDTIRSAPERSALFTTNTSAISMRPAFIACTASPASGTSVTTTVSATRITSSSVWPTPTVSTYTTSLPQASSSLWAAQTTRDRPPCAPLVARLRMNTPRSRKCCCIRMRSPSTAPPLNGLVGSTASTPTLSPSSREVRTKPSTRVLLPAPGGPVMPTVYARPAWAWVARTMAARVSLSRSSRVNSRASARRLPPVASSTSCETTLGRSPRRSDGLR